MWLPYKFSTVVRRARGARTDTSKIESNKTNTEHSNNRILAAVIPSFTVCYIATSDAIHRVRISYSNFHLQKRVAILTTHICSSFKIGRTYEIHPVLLPLKTREWRQSIRQRIIDTHACVVVSKFYDVTNMRTKKTRDHFSRISFGEFF